MYVRRTLPSHFPANYRGNLDKDSIEHNHSEKHTSHHTPDSNTYVKHKYTVRKNARCLNDKDDILSIFQGASNDDILLFGLLIFLYVGCDHTKENLLLIGAIAYLLFSTKIKF